MISGQSAAEGRYVSRKRICASLSIVPGRAERTAATASSQDRPNPSISTSAAMVPVRPIPAAQWSTTLSPRRSRDLRSSSRARSCATGRRSGAAISGMGTCSHSNRQDRTMAGNPAIPRCANSSGSIRVTSAEIPAFSSASRSASRLRCQCRPSPSRPDRPGAWTMPNVPPRGKEILLMTSSPDRKDSTDIASQ